MRCRTVGQCCRAPRPTASSCSTVRLPTSVLSRPPHIWGGLLVCRAFLNHHFSKWGGRAPPHFGKKWGGRTFLKMCTCRFGGYFWGVFSFQPPKIPKIFFARAFGARESLLYLFGRRRAQKQRIREPVCLALCSFGPSTAVLVAFRALICTHDGSTTSILSSRAARPCKSMQKIMHLA